MLVFPAGTGTRLLILSIATLWLSFARDAVYADDAHTWNPAKTRVFIVCLARFEGETTPSFSTDDRLDGRLAEVFKARGVPKDHIVMLLDDRATSENIKFRFTNFLHDSKPDELLIFYFGSHGSYSAKTGKYFFSTFDGSLPFDWAFDAIEHDFEGSRAIMFADCCYSGGIGEIAAKRDTHIAYACISSAFCHNVAYSGWRFIDCMLRGFSGAPVVDPDGTGHVDLSDLARYMAGHMAFVAEGKSSFVTTGDFDRHLVLANTAGKKSDTRVGEYVEARDHDGKWYKAEIVDVRGAQLHVKGTDQHSSMDRWVPTGDVRAFKFKHFDVGARVSVESSGKWYPATVLERWESLHLIHYDGYSAAYDEWVGPSRIAEQER